ncbi:hypothetical protein [Natrinema pallidum]|uniref:Uncharacterized protein n=2 Tax=Natrinema pallidum TaxID=69527 RepID=L9YQ63_9EURY|nr:hypothetical protein [Natrinema pallidum]ELY75033.1 hypothetical protein C487_13759 [Natrinema pallidum DSM 3751]QCW04334.1 hypothetical protein FGF80_14330 [Natrinema pallidum]
MDGVLNEATDKLHKYESGQSDFQTTCGATSHVSHDHLRLVPVEQTATDGDVNRCGRCFTDGDSY